MIALYIIGGLLALLILLGLCDLTLALSYDHAFYLTFRFLFFRVKILPASEEKGEKKEKKNAPKSAAEQPGETKAEKNSVGDTLHALRLLLKLLGDFLGATRLRPCRLYVSVGGEDAAKAATTYGAFCAALGSMEAVFNESFRRVKTDFRIGCDFQSPETQIVADIRARLRIFAVLGVLVRFARKEDKPLKFLLTYFSRMKQPKKDDTATDCDD